MWDILEVTHEGTIDVKSARKHALIQKYEIFRMLKGETISDVQKRFTHIVNHLISLGKISKGRNLASRSSNTWTDLGSLKSLLSLHPRI